MVKVVASKDLHPGKILPVWKEKSRKMEKKR
jgi:hypothetical protein